ncbi:amino acid adenylation domain [Streptomyces sp. NL15-2K]|nr:amino acid adenylation domain [Streptomyces sp. NL15-2K]
MWEVLRVSSTAVVDGGRAYPVVLPAGTVRAPAAVASDRLRGLPAAELAEAVRTSTAGHRSRRYRLAVVCHDPGQASRALTELLVDGAARSGTRLLPRLGRDAGVTPYMTLLSAFAALLGGHTDDHEPVIGSPVAGRSWAELQGVVGYFVDMSAMRLDVTPRSSPGRRRRRCAPASAPTGTTSASSCGRAATASAATWSTAPACATGAPPSGWPAPTTGCSRRSPGSPAQPSPNCANAPRRRLPGSPRRRPRPPEDGPVSPPRRKTAAVNLRPPG